MGDRIRGPVLEVIDGDSFLMEVTHVARTNQYEYGNQEEIRLEWDEPELWTPAGKRSKESLKRKLRGKTVRCYIRTRDRYGRLVCGVKVLG